MKITLSPINLSKLKQRASSLIAIGAIGLLFPVIIVSQNPRQKRESRPTENKIKESPTDLPAFAISLVISLSNDARSYSDPVLRPRVLARAADVLWDADNITARELFKRAWEAAEKGDADEVTLKRKDNPPAMAMALLRLMNHDLRLEVLKVVARRDSALAEHFFTKLKNELDGERKEVTKSFDDDWSVPEAVSKRLRVASVLLKDDQIERALEIAAPVLDRVNLYTISFLTELRTKDPATADRMFSSLMVRSELDPTSGANTVSGLSSYVLTPGLYVSFKPEGGVRWQQPDDESTTTSSSVRVELRDRFFQVAAKILLRPSPSNQEASSSARRATHDLIKRLLPVFEQHAPEIAPTLRARLMELAGASYKDSAGAEEFPLTQGIRPPPRAEDALSQMQERIDRAKSARERDSIYAAAAMTLMNQGDLRARDMADKIENVQRRTEIRQNVDFEFVQRAVRKKDAKEALRLVQSGKLSNTQRAAAYIDVARTLREAESQRAAELLEDAVREIRRIEGDKSDRAVLLIGVANNLLAGDRVRAWEIADEAVKEVNRLEEFNPEHVLVFPLMTSSGVKFIYVDGEHFNLASLFRALARDDLYRALDLAKSFKYDAPRAAVTLAIASSILQKEKTGLQN